jgi:hypothetical protein
MQHHIAKDNYLQDFSRKENYKREKTKLKTKLRGLSLRANYNDRVTAKLVPNLHHMVSVTDPYGHNLGFLDRSRYFFFQVAP